VELRTTLADRRELVLDAAGHATRWSHDAECGYYQLANALLGPKESVLVSGPILAKEVTITRHTGRDYYITLRVEGREVVLAVSDGEYQGLDVGQSYSREMIRGAFGVYYTWGVPWWK
jgi:hypothetical protein